MLVKNKMGWKLIEYVDIEEKDIKQYPNVTGAYAILKIADKYVVGYNGWRKQWEFIALKGKGSDCEAGIFFSWRDTDKIMSGKHHRREAAATTNLKSLN